MNPPTPYSELKAVPAELVSTHDVVFVDRDLERAATDRWLRKHRDQPLSLADAVSFEVMRSRRIRQALALDERFELAGFDRVP